MHKTNPLASAAGDLFYAAQHVHKPIILPMFPPGNSLGLQPDQIQPGQPKLPSDCNGVVFAVSCTAGEAQALINLITSWQQKRESDRDGR